MAPARNLQLFPEQAGKPSTRRERGTYGITDNQVIAYQKRHGRADTRVLTALAEQANYREKTLTIAELSVETDLGQRAVEKALVTLRAAGFVAPQGKAWIYTKPGEANGRANSCSHNGTHDGSQTGTGNAVLCGKSIALKEVEGIGRNLKTFNNITGTNWAVRPAPVVAAGGDVQETTPGQDLAPDGAASGEAQAGHLDPFQGETADQHGGNENVTGTEEVPAAGPKTYREAQEILTAAGAWDVWATWVKDHRPARSAQNLQILDFARWVQLGLTAELRQSAQDVTKAGSYAHPFAGLTGRMKGAAKVAETAAANRAEVGRVFGTAKCLPGQRRRAPNGQVWTVETVEYGLVYFAEAHAPRDLGDAIVARWTLEGGEA